LTKQSIMDRPTEQEIILEVIQNGLRNRVF
jgi:hypothetical protein